MAQEETESLALEISGFSAQCYIGVKEVEKACRQKVLVDIKIHLDPALGSGDPQIDYDDICAALRKLLDEEKFGLLEELTGRIANLLGKDFGAENCEVRCTKPRVHSDVVGIAVVRTRGKGAG